MKKRISRARKKNFSFSFSSGCLNVQNLIVNIWKESTNKANYGELTSNVFFLLFKRFFYLDKNAILKKNNQMNSGKIRSNMITGAVGEVCTFFFLFFSPEATGDSKVTSSQRCKQQAPFYIQTHESFTRPGRSGRGLLSSSHPPKQPPMYPLLASSPGARRQPQRLLLFHPRGRSSITECSPSHEGNITLK